MATDVAETSEGLNIYYGYYKVKESCTPVTIYALKMVTLKRTLRLIHQLCLYPGLYRYSYSSQQCWYK